MGILMKASDVCAGIRGERRPDGMATSGDYCDGAPRASVPRLRESPLKAYNQHRPGADLYSAQAAPCGPRPALEPGKPSSSLHQETTVIVKDQKVTQPPPKKKWIKEYLEEEPHLPVKVRVVPAAGEGAAAGGLSPRGAGVVLARAASPAPDLLLAPALLDFAQEHSRPRANSHGQSTPSPPSVGSSGSSGSGGARAGTREVHNKLEKNRRAHLKECFELLKSKLPPTTDDKKTSNLSILHSAIRYIQVLRRKERECEHEVERLAREKIAAQQKLAALRREVSALAARPRAEPMLEDKDRNERVNGQVLGIPVSVAGRSPSPPRSLNLSTKLRALPLQLTPTAPQLVRTSYSARHSSLTLAPAPPDHAAPSQNGQQETGSLGLVHPAHVHLPLSQVMGGGLVVGGALQLLAPGGLRVLHAPQLNGESARISRENGLAPPPSTESGVLVGGLAPLVVSQPSHLLHTHTLTHKMVETQLVKAPGAAVVSAQYLSAALGKPLVVVSTASQPSS